MKKLIAFVLAMLMLVSLVACGGNAGNNNDTKDTSDTSDSTDTTDTGSTPAVVEKNPLEVMTNGWDKVDGDLKAGPFFGGDFTGEPVEGAPGTISVNETDAVVYGLVFPESCMDKIDAAACLRHMMNSNNFTAVAVHAKNASDVNALVSAITDGVLNNMWCCGFPEKVVVLTVDEVVVYAFGVAGWVDTLANGVTAAYSQAKIVEDTNL